MDELYRNRRLGLSFKGLGKKIGIDCSREEVVRIFDIARENSPGNLPNVQTMPISAKRQLPTPLWFLFSSELDEIAQHALPKRADVLSTGPHVRVQERLGEDSAPGCYKPISPLAKLFKKKLRRTLIVPAGVGKLCELEQWGCKLPSKLLSQTFDTAHSVAEASFHMTREWRPGEGRCQCGSTKRLRFTWKTVPVAYPSFFWGCVNYNRGDQARHDRATPCSGTLCACITAYFPLITTGDLVILKDRVAEVIKLWEDNESPMDTDYQQATNFYGGQKEQLPHTTKGVLKALQMVTSDLQCMLDERAGLCDKQKLVCHAITSRSMQANYNTCC